MSMSKFRNTSSFTGQEFFLLFYKKRTISFLWMQDSRDKIFPFSSSSFPWDQMFNDYMSIVSLFTLVNWISWLSRSLILTCPSLSLIIKLFFIISRIFHLLYSMISLIFREPTFATSLLRFASEPFQQNLRKVARCQFFELIKILKVSQINSVMQIIQ